MNVLAELISTHLQNTSQITQEEQYLQYPTSRKVPVETNDTTMDVAMAEEGFYPQQEQVPVQEKGWRDFE